MNLCINENINKLLKLTDQICAIDQGFNSPDAGLDKKLLSMINENFEVIEQLIKIKKFIATGEKEKAEKLIKKCFKKYNVIKGGK